VLNLFAYWYWIDNDIELEVNTSTKKFYSRFVNKKQELTIRIQDIIDKPISYDRLQPMKTKIWGLN
jgi:hypothetical protein